MTIVRVDARDREVTDWGMETTVRLFFQRVGKWIEDRSFKVLFHDSTGLWSLDIEDEPVLTDVGLREIAQAL